MTEKSPSETSFKYYGITITFRKPLEHLSKPFNQYNYTRIIISKILGESTVDFRCIPEFTVHGRIHYHGILKIKNFTKWVKSTLPSLRKMGYVKIETFKEELNSKRWMEYMYKSVEDTKNIMNIKDNIEVNMYDYKLWKQKEPTIENFVGKPKVVAQVKPSRDMINQLPTNINRPNYILDYIDDDGNAHYKASYWK